MITKVFVIESGYSSSFVEIPFSEKVSVTIGEEVIFKDEEEKEEYCIIKNINVDSEDPNTILFTGTILRKATANDVQKVDSHIDLAKAALKKCQEIANQHGLEMNVFRCGYSFDASRIHFLFTSDDRVDFRDLVKDLAKVLKKQIHLRQIGPRDKAKYIGGYGKCGRPLCCSTWLGKLESINMEMVRMQSLESKGSSKLSGSCGKLLCCLKYEVEAYKDLRKSLPNIGTRVKVKKSVEAHGDHEGEVIGLDILNQKLKLFLGEGNYAVVGINDIVKK
ncbi:hypothetical protein HY605_04155 [Candidatus Peregrinibacteria bacterium]|nr:hypothetical protein [Candidatus Peregrinibacteria bacterium]